MRRSDLVWIAILLIAAILGFNTYQNNWSPAAHAKTAAAAVFAAAVEGDHQRVASFLAADAGVTAEQVVDLYQGLDRLRVDDVHSAPPGRAGVEYHATGVYVKNGYVATTSLALKREEGRWVVVQAGQNYSY